MEKQRLLRVSFSQDITHANEGQIEAFKALWRSSLEPAVGTVHFEIREIDPYARVKSMLRLVRSEFEVNNDEPVTDSERPDLVEDEP